MIYMTGQKLYDSRDWTAIARFTWNRNNVSMRQVSIKEKNMLKIYCDRNSCVH